ncbi:SagB/ThcOx family dehydrogenase [Halorientalis brevis]|uniref:SagB/ThcOx family dehydrogenase n=1 Tax=Halorientalis brevis TaxID=1126241 RepID=A0ABD6CHF9_9EURY|nr:SagB/ThcOx family dehydrogenase [Halorientalis brevis]
MAPTRLSRQDLLRTFALGIGSVALSVLLRRFDRAAAQQGGNRIRLPEPSREGDTSVEAAISARRSRRSYRRDPLDLATVSQLLWAAQGITEPSTGHRAAPSAGATYPLELYVVVGDPGVAGLDAGVYRYDVERHGLERLATGNRQSDLRAAALDQEWVGQGAIDVVVCADDERTTAKYGPRGKERYVPMEAGHVGENLYLQAESLDLAMVTVGAFRDERVRELVDAPQAQRPLYVIPIGART